MEFFSYYGMFLLKLVSVIIAILVLLAGILAIASKGKAKTKGKLKITALNKKYHDYSEQVYTILEDKTALKKLKKQQKQKSDKNPRRLFVIDFQGDIRASQLDALREEVTALLLTASKDDEVLVRVESAGGMVNAYGLAASQLHRIKQAKIKLTVAIDKVAASGGYMMACVADHIIAAPFSIVGSIGVVAQLPNFHQFLKKHHVEFEQITAGEYKRTLSLFGENTEKGREKMQQDIDITHDLFKSFIVQNRSQVDINQVATGEHWFAETAKQFKLVDELNTSDDFLLQLSKKLAIFEIRYTIKKTLAQRLTSNASNLLNNIMYNK